VHYHYDGASGSTHPAAVPFYQFLCKIHTTCNLACDYCYVYYQADQSWRTKPVRMSADVLAQLARRIREHILEFSIPDVQITMHGGEPMLAGAKFIRRFIGELKASLADTCTAQFGMQSNGTRLTPELLKIIVEEKIAVGISLDGDERTNDWHRLDHAGRSSYVAVVKAIEQLRARERLSGLLCTINLEADPVATYQHLAQLQPPNIDFTFPLGHHDAPPLGKRAAFDQTPYADWLIPIFDVWFAERPQRLSIRLFQNIIRLLLGGESSVETIGIGSVDLVVIETDGTLEGVDTLKVVEDGAPQLDLNIFDHSFADAMSHPMVRLRQMGLEALCQSCQRCPVGSVCGGGYFPTRFSRQNGFRNPSIYCADYYKLIRHIREKVVAQARGAGVSLQASDMPLSPPTMM
jgi:uncharacterized protein